MITRPKSLDTSWSHENHKKKGGLASPSNPSLSASKYRGSEGKPELVISLL